MKKHLFLFIGLFVFTFVFAGSPPGPTIPDNFYVDVNVVGGLEDGSSWEDAFLTIQEGINAAGSSDNVFVAAGVYNVGSTTTPGYTLENRVYLNKSIGVRAVDGPGVTIIEGAEATGGGNGADAVRAVFITVGTLEGFTIRNGHTRTTGDTAEDSLFNRSGGGIFFTGGTVNTCIISENAADVSGGAAILYGGGTLNNSLLTDNTSASGAGVLIAGGTMNNCTLSGNVALDYGGGAALYSGAQLRNSILWGNSAGVGGNDIDDDTGAGANGIYNSCASDGMANGVACTTSDPLFIDADNDNYRIFVNSPCLNTGSDSYDYGSVDLDENARIQCGEVDMGAYENAGVAFTDGSAYSTTLSLGVENQAFGRFQLNGSTTGGSITGAMVKVDGARTGFSNFRLWSSPDASFEAGSDTPLGSTVTTDPGNGGTVSFSSFTSSIPTSETYYFVTADVASNATGSIQGVIVQNNYLTLVGAISETISNASLSLAGTEVPTPITLASFMANTKKGCVELEWTTASETENSHFLVYRDGEVIGQVEGNGTCTDPHDYVFVDDQVTPGVHEYALADVTYGGEAVMHDAVSVNVESRELSVEEFILNKAYPNPFNPTTVMSMRFANGSDAVVNIYNTQGVLVDQLINGFVEAGDHEIIWDAATMSSGVYLVTMQAGNTLQSQKIVLMK